MDRRAALGQAYAGAHLGLGDTIQFIRPVPVARVIQSLHPVISVDSMPAHLAAALGRPTRTLLRANADWRWKEGRDDCPWYPTMRLFRQPRDGE